MSFTHHQEAELRALLEALCEEQITPEQLATLEAIVLADPRAEEFCITYMTIQADLVRGIGAREGSLLVEGAGAGPAAAADIRPDARTGRHWLWVPWVLVAAASIVAALTLGLSLLAPQPGAPAGVPARGPSAVVAKLVNDRSEPTAGPPSAKEPGIADNLEEATSSGVAILTRGVNVMWDSASPPPEIGSILTTGPLRFRSGILQLEFYGGATVVLEGPAEIELKGIDEIMMRSGKLRAKVSPPARGFRVHSPDMDVVDLGTEFGMQVLSGDKSEVHVFDGKVEISETSSRSGRAVKWELAEGDGVRIRSGGKFTELDTQSTVFMGQSELERLCLEEARGRYKQWLSRSRSLSDDRRVVTYFTFEADRDAGSRTLVNQCGDRSMDGAIIGCNWVDGRWPGKGAVEFKRPGDRVRIHIPGEFESLTLCAWVRIDAIENRLNSLMLTDGYDRGEVHWQIDHSGQIIFGIRSESEKGLPTKSTSPPVVTPERFGRWMHLAATFDHRDQVVTHYLDGAAVGSGPLLWRIPGPLRIGDAEIGNWGVPFSPKNAPIRNLCGRIDEFVMFRDALGPDEIRILYEHGMPRP